MEDIIKKRFKELIERADKGGYFVFTDFCTPAEVETAYEAAASAKLISAWGGTDSSERVILRFGDPGETGYEEAYPIRIVKVSPKAPKFAEQLTHRDFLGAILNLGIERSAVGDITVHDNAAYIFVVERLAEFVVESLTRVKHTTVISELISELPEEARPKIKKEAVNVPAERLDGIVAKVYGMSREQAKNLFAAGRVSVGGRECRSPDRKLSEGDIVSVRGQGKFVFCGVSGETKKGRLNVEIGRYC